MKIASDENRNVVKSKSFRLQFAMWSSNHKISLFFFLWFANRLVFYLWNEANFYLQRFFDSTWKIVSKSNRILGTLFQKCSLWNFTYFPYPFEIRSIWNSAAECGAVLHKKCHRLKFSDDNFIKALNETKSMHLMFNRRRSVFWAVNIPNVPYTS